MSLIAILFVPGKSVRYVNFFFRLSKLHAYNPDPSVFYLIQILLVSNSAHILIKKSGNVAGFFYEILLHH